MFLLRGNETIVVVEKREEGDYIEFLLICRLSGVEEFADKIHHDNQETKTADNF
jgi:hypothetical protein